MTNSCMMPAEIFHVRSISMPSRSHPLVFKIEEELHKLKSCYDLKGIEELYSCIDEFLHLPSTQQALSHCIEKKWLENELEGSVRLLDLCGAIKDMLVTVEEQVQELQLAFRKRGESASDQELIREQIFSKKETRRNMKNCQNLLKRVERRCGSCPSMEKTHDLSTVARLLIEAREVTISLLRSVLSSMSGTKTNVSRWSFISNAMNGKRVAYNREYCESSRVAGSICFENVEAGLVCLFRQLMRNRVSLLNILSL